MIVGVDMSEASAMALAEAIRISVESTGIGTAADGGGVITVSVGVTSVVPGIDHALLDTIGSARKALDEARKRGGNQVLVS